MSSLVRAIVRLHLRARRDKPVGNGIAIFTDDHIGTKIILDGAFARDELETLDKYVFPHIPQPSVALDIGGNIGNHARFFAPRFAHVFSFEPHPRTALLLTANAMGRNITALGYGLSDRAADLSATGDTANMGGSRIDPAGDTTFHVARLDDVIAGLTDAPIGFVKIDVEGHEAAVIAGGAETLRTHQPVVAIEVDRGVVVDGTCPALDALRGFGYAHVYAFENTAGWTRIRAKVPQRIARTLVRLFAPSRVYDTRMVPVARLKSRDYPLLIVSPRAL